MVFVRSKETDIMHRTASIILAGGQGTRLFPLTQTRCKPAVCFGGRYRLIDIPMSNSINAQIENVFVISQYFASFLNEHILGTYALDHFRPLKIHLLCPEETDSRKSWFKGTGDAVRQNLNHFKACPAEYFLILSGDQLYNMNLREMFELAQQTGADLTIASLPVEEKEAKRMGLLKIQKGVEISDFVEKPSDPAILKQFALTPDFLKGHLIAHPNATHYLGSMGIYIFKREALFSLLEEEGDDFGRDLIPKQLKKGKTVAYLYKDYWEDIGTITSYFESNLALTQQIAHRLDLYDVTNPIYAYPHSLPGPLVRGGVVQRSILSEGSMIEAKEITDSVLGVNVIVEKGTTLHHTIVVGNPSETARSPKKLAIGEHCLIQNTIIDEHASVGNNVQLVNRDHLSTYEKDGIFIRDGIIIVTSGTHVPDGFVL